MIVVLLLSISTFVNFGLAAQHPHFKTGPALNPEEIDPIYWLNNAQETIKSKLKIELNHNTAKNVIFFIGDGMDLTTVNAARVYMNGNEEKYLFFENFPHSGLSVTYCVDRKVADSACSSTAYLTGVKGNYATIGMTANVKRYDCNAYSNSLTHTESILRWAQLSGKSTGIVTNTRVTHATPAGAYAHTAERYWESDADVKDSNCDPDVAVDIAQQLIKGSVGEELNVVMGGGRRMFIDQTFTDEEGDKGSRRDNRNLIDEWKDFQTAKRRRFNYIWSKTELKNLDFNNTDYLLGLFESDHCHYNLDIQNQNLEEEPTLTEMVEAAVKILQKNDKGYFLFVEGGKIDMAHHSTKAHYAMEETAELAQAVQKAVELTDAQDTLVVVSADHGHAVMYNGYGPRGHNILGTAQKSYEDLLPWTTISYANGKGYYETYNENGGRKNWDEDVMKDPNTRYMATVPRDSETHGGAHVGVWAIGPQSHLFIGTYEENALPFIMAHAAKIGPYSTGAATIVMSSHKLIMTVIMGFILKSLTQ